MTFSDKEHVHFSQSSIFLYFADVAFLDDGLDEWFR